VASETGTNGGTRTIDGLAVTRDPWTINRSYTCWTSKAVDSLRGSDDRLHPDQQGVRGQ
jgi:hypothetical protein